MTNRLRIFFQRFRNCDSKFIASLPRGKMGQTKLRSFQNIYPVFQTLTYISAADGAAMMDGGCRGNLSILVCVPHVQSVSYRQLNCPLSLSGIDGACDVNSAATLIRSTLTLSLWVSLSELCGADGLRTADNNAKEK